jgi:hypothetical protein
MVLLKKPIKNADEATSIIESVFLEVADPRDIVKNRLDNE